MLILITGGVKNGKSSLGEDMCREIASGKLCYIATMYRNPDDDEVAQRIARHREMRANKGFRTFERYTDIGSLELGGYDTALLECLPNLLANEMFMKPGGTFGAADRIGHGLTALKRNIRNLVVISNEVGADGVDYSEETRDYQAALAALNAQLGAFADAVYEVVCGIPVRLK